VFRVLRGSREKMIEEGEKEREGERERERERERARRIREKTEKRGEGDEFLWDFEI
jgi:hypothetical protein